MNFTIQLPIGTTNHGDPHLICTPATWKDLLVFYVTNYFIHAATLPTSPGETKVEIVFAVFNALFIPGYGIVRVCRRLAMFPGLRRGLSPIQRACASGALCMVVHKTTWNAVGLRSPMDKGGASQQDPENNPAEESWGSGWLTDTIHGGLSNAQVSPSRNIHGVCDLPKGYRLCIVPFGAQLRQSEAAGGSGGTTVGTSSGIPFSLSSEYGLVKALFSLVQIIAGSITIYRTRGDHITQYGYAAFGLSVVPYVLMSAVNAVASILGPGYPAMYLVRTPDMDRAESEDNGHFEGIVAEWTPHSAQSQQNLNGGGEKPTITNSTGRPGKKVIPATFIDNDWSMFVGLSMMLLSFLFPIGFIGGLSGYDTGLISTTAQRGWTMAWIVVGSMSSVVAIFLQDLIRSVPGDLTRDKLPNMVLFLAITPLWIPAIGGMISVGGQLRAYGICTRFDF